MNCRSFNQRKLHAVLFSSKKDGVIIHDARIPQTTKLILNGARDDTMQCLIKESGLRESNQCQKMIKGKPR